MATLAFALRRPATYLLALSLAVTLGCGGSEGRTEGALVVTSTAFASSGTIPDAHGRGTDIACPGTNTAPPVSWSWTPSASPSVESYAIVMVDVTAVFTHWILYNIPVATTTVPANGPYPAGAAEARNDFGLDDYDGPCPLAGPPEHTYVITVYALSVADVTTDGGWDATNPAAAIAAIKANSIASGDLPGTYTRN